MSDLRQIKPNVVLLPNPEQILEQQLMSYMKVFQNIADQIGELNERVVKLQNAAE
ncbi:MAG: hypothetical protein ACXAC7_08730 [Candidatus Hodarchaeales archaeon]|jgi:hypothetical protein